MTKMRNAGSLFGLCLLGCAALAAACGDDDDADDSQAATAGRAGGAAGHAGGGEPLYVIESEIIGADNQTSYVTLLPTLDRSEKVEFSGAREFPGYSPADPWQGSLLVSSGESPEVTKFTVSGDNKWSEVDTLSFSNQTDKPIERNIVVSDDKAYVPFEKTNFITWNPDSFELGHEVGFPEEIALMRGDAKDLLVNRGYYYELRGNTLYQPYYWSDVSFQLYTQDSQVSVIDTTQDKVTSVQDVPCPHMHITTQDDAGNIYLSNGSASVPAAVISGGKLHNCFAKIPKGQDSIDPDSVTDFRSLTDGLEGGNLFYVGGHLAIFNAYHADRDNLGDKPDASKISYSRNYHLWSYDLESHEAKLLEGVDYAGGQIVVFPIDGRYFLTIPAGDYSATEVYEIKSSGEATKLFDVEGWAFKIFRLR